MTNPKEYFLGKLKQNLITKEEADEIVDLAKNGRKKLKKKWAKDEIANTIDLNCLSTRGVHKSCSQDSAEEFCPEDLKSASVVPSEDFAKAYQEKHLVEPVSFGLLIPERVWEKIGMEVGDKKAHGYFIEQISFQFYNGKLPLKELGLILLADSDLAPIALEHEMIHADCNIYSKNQRRLSTWQVGDYFLFSKKYEEDEIIAKLESHVRTELVAESSHISEDKDSIGNTLTQSYFTFYRETLGKFMDNYSPREISRMFGKLEIKVWNTLETLKILVPAIGERLVTPLLFSVGPTETEMRNHYYGSCLDDITLLGEAVMNGNFSIKEIREGLEEKGYKP